MDDLDFSSVYARHARDVYRFALYLTGHVETAEDVAAETFARAWTVRGRIEVASVKAYLLMIARNLCRDAHRRPSVQAWPEGLDVADTAVDQERTAGARQAWQQVVRDLGTLSEVDRSALLMATMEGLSYAAIGEALGLSEAAVKVRVHRARLQLHEARRNREHP